MTDATPDACPVPERGAPDGEVLERAVLDFLARRPAASTACPSEVARALDPAAWRPLMAPVREAARRLALRGQVEITQRGAPLDPRRSWRGPVRLRRGPGWRG